MSLPTDFKERYGKWALITGAAQGIGAAYGERLAAMGLSLVLLDIETELLEAHAARLRQTNPAVEIKTLVSDLGNPDALNAAIDQIAGLEIGLLVANAGIGAVGRWLEVPLAVKLNQIAVNCTAVLILAHRLTPPMVERRRGGVIIMASNSAEMGASFIATYSATKAFDRVLAEGLWAELSPHGIDVTAVMPGAIDTPGFRASIPAGHEPIPAMRPRPPFDIVDAALEGLGREINVKLGSSLRGALLSRALSRKAMLKLRDQAVRAMYDR